MATQSNPSNAQALRNQVVSLSESARLRQSAETFGGFIDQQRSRGREITPELRDSPPRFRDKANAVDAFANRPLRCKLGLHKRKQAWYGGWIAGTCVICRREDNI